MKNFNLHDEVLGEVLKYQDRKKTAERKARATARAAANAEVARVSRVGKHLVKDDLDDVWQEKFDSTFKSEMENFETAEMDQIFASLEPVIFSDDEAEEVDPPMSDDYVLEDYKYLDLLPGATETTTPPIGPCYECQSRPCRCEEFAGKALLEAALMDDLIRIDDEDDDILDNGACGTCHNWPCVCGSVPDDF